MDLLKYQRSDGQIVAVWSSNSADILASQVDETDAAYGYLTGTDDLPSPRELVEHWRVVDGVVVSKD